MTSQDGANALRRRFHAQQILMAMVGMIALIGSMAHPLGFTATSARKLTQDNKKVIDYATYLGGAGDDEGGFIAVLADASMVLVGTTNSNDFPVVGDGSRGYIGGTDIVIAHIDRTGSSLLNSTYFGGSGDDRVAAIHLNGSDELFIVGETTSRDLNTINAIREAPIPSSCRVGGSYVPCTDGYVIRFDTLSWQPTFLTYFGGEGMDSVNSVAMTASVLLLGGETSSRELGGIDLATSTFGGGIRDGFVASIDLVEPVVAKGRYVGGSGYDVVTAVAPGDSERVVFAGLTNSTDLPTVNALQSRLGGGRCGEEPCQDGFLGALSLANASMPEFLTYHGGSLIDRLFDVVSDETGRISAVGVSQSADFPMAAAGGGGVLCRDQDARSCAVAVLVQVAASGTELLYSGVLGPGDTGERIARESTAVDLVIRHNTLLISGSTNDPQWRREALIDSTGGFDDVFVLVLDRSTRMEMQAAILGGERNDVLGRSAWSGFGKVVTSGYTASQEFPVVGAIQATRAGGRDLFIAQVDFRLSPPTASATPVQSTPSLQPPPSAETPPLTETTTPESPNPTPPASDEFDSLLLPWAGIHSGEL